MNEFFKKHTDTIVVLSAIFSTFIWMSGRLSTIEKDMSDLKQEIAIVKTIMIMKNLMPAELAIKE